MVTRDPRNLATSDLVARVRAYTDRYTRNSYSGNMFRNYADSVAELLDRLGPEPELRNYLRVLIRAELEPELRAEVLARIERAEMHTEYAPVLPGGMVIDQMATAEPTTPDDRLQVASRLVTPWRYGHDPVV